MTKFLSKTCWDTWYNDQKRQKMEASIIFGAKIQMPTFLSCLVPANIQAKMYQLSRRNLLIDLSSLRSHIEIEQRLAKVGALTVKD